jgi:hypothetical protein
MISWQYASYFLFLYSSGMCTSMKSEAEWRKKRRRVDGRAGVSWRWKLGDNVLRWQLITGTREWTLATPSRFSVVLWCWWIARFQTSEVVVDYWSWRTIEKNFKYLLHC